jgi:hypothetical protein
MPGFSYVIMNLFNSILRFLINLNWAVVLLITLPRIKQKSTRITKTYLSVQKGQVKLLHMDLIVNDKIV